MGCTASQAEFGQRAEHESPKETSTLHFILKESPAVLSFRGDSYIGSINPSAKVCWVSFPGKYATAWESLISQHHEDSVACVFLCDTKNGLGQHHFPNGNAEQCLCAEIYGERNYKDLGYLQEVKDTCTEPERAKHRERAKAMNSHIVFGKASDEDRKQAEKLWVKNKKRASWGCAWFEKWFRRVKTAVDLGQRLKVVYFPRQVGCGKVAWSMLPKVNLWDGNGCGGSQKGEIAKLDEMQRIDRSGRWNYDEVDVTDFLIAQFKSGDIVDAFDSDQNGFVTAELLQTPAPDDAKNHLDMKWQVVCKKTRKRFETKHLRHGTDFFEKLLDVFGKDSLEKIVQDATKLNVKSIYESRLQNGMLSLAVDFDLTCIQERHQLRDAVLSDDLTVSLNNALEKRGFAEQLAVENTLFFQQYAASLLTFSKLTDHQTEKLKELSRYLHEDVHLSAPAGGGKTFLAVRHAMNKLRSSSKGKILFISPNRPLCFHFVHWLLMHARSSPPKVSRNKLLQRLVLMHAPYDRFTRTQIAADSYIVLEELKAMPDDLVLAIFDEAHAIFRTNQGIFQEVRAKCKLILSDRSQSLFLETKYPEMRRVNLNEVVRSTKRVVLGANAFRLQDDEPTTCLGTTGPPLKSFIFESPEEYDEGFFAQFADHTVKALWFILCAHPSIRLDKHVALLVPDEEFYRNFRLHLEEHLESAFAPMYNMKLVSFEDSLRFLPEAAHQDGKRDELILDWDSNATGLESLFVVCIGFDVQITGKLDNFTRARLYHAITRAQLQALVVDRLVYDGWLAYLTTLKLRETPFRLGGAESEINKAAALKIVEEAAQSEAGSSPEAATKVATFQPGSAKLEINKAAVLKTVKEAAQSEAGSSPEAATKATSLLKATSPLTLRDSWVWDTSANICKADIGKLRFDPLVKDNRLAMISARYPGSETEKKIREVHQILSKEGYNILIVDADLEDDFGVITRRYWNQVRENNGVLIPVCTRDYGEKTGNGFSTHEDLKYALDNRLEILPLRMENTYPPEPSYGPDHPYDKDGEGQSLIRRAFPPSKVYLDCRNRAADEIANELGKRLLEAEEKATMEEDWSVFFKTAGIAAEEESQLENPRHRQAMFAARFLGGEVEHKLREVYKILKDMGLDVLMVPTDAGEDFGILTMPALGRIVETRGVLLAVCTHDLGEKTASPYSSFEVLKNAWDNGLEIWPLRMEDTYPPEPSYGPNHPWDKRGLGRALVKLAFPRGKIYMDCRDRTAAEIADQLEKELRLK